MTTLKEFEDELREQGMRMALAILDRLRERDRARRTSAPARRVTGRKMTAEVAHRILDLHRTTGMTQQEIAFQLGVNQGRVNEVIKRGKWLSGDLHSPEAAARDSALARVRKGVGKERRRADMQKPRSHGEFAFRRPAQNRRDRAQLSLGDF